MREQKSRATVMDTATRSHLEGGPLGRALGGIPAGTILEREVIDVTKPGDAFRHYEPGAITIKSGL